MKTNGFTGFMKLVGSAVKKHSPEILTAIGVVGMVGAAVMAVKATPKATAILEARKKELNTDKLTVKETVKSAWKCYIPAAVTGAVSICCIVGADKVSLSRKAALSAAYALSETKLKDYSKKVVESVGEKKEKDIRGEVKAEQLKKHPVHEQEVILTERGNTLCYDELSGRYFKSDIDYIRKVENVLNKRLLSEMVIPLNDFYYELGIPSIKLGDYLGWDIDILGDGGIELEYDSMLTSDGMPCLVIGCRTVPKYSDV